MGLPLRSIQGDGVLLYHASLSLHLRQGSFHCFRTEERNCPGHRFSHYRSGVPYWRKHLPALDGQEDQRVQYFDRRYQFPQCDFPSRIHRCLQSTCESEKNWCN